jgi:hypothetical protein
VHEPPYIPAVRTTFDRVADVAFAVVAAALGAAIALAPLSEHGLVLGGSACGGGGNAQRCTGIARQLSLVEISPRAWAFVAGGVLCVLLAAAALVLRRRTDVRLGIAIAVLALAFVGLVQVERVDALLGPEDGGTWGRSLEDWGPLLSPELADLRRDALRRYEGTRTEPGGPLYDREQILPYFFAHVQDGWRVLRGAVVVLFFVALFETLRRLVRRPTLAVTTTATVGLVVWVMVLARAVPCLDGGECWEGLATMLAVVAAGIWWLAYATGIVLGRFVERLRTPRT